MERLDIAGKSKQIADLEERASQPEFWNDPAASQSTMKALNDLRALVDHWQALAQRGLDTAELIELGDESMAADLAAEVDAIEHELDQRELLLMLSGAHDRGNALLALHAGAGGVDAADWNSMLLRMFLRWAEQRGFKAEVVDQVDGDEGGIKNATVMITGEYAYGYLRSERGVHRLVRLSPFDSAHRRHTSFALVEVWPDLGEGDEVDLKPQDIKIDTYKSAGAGGQNVQKNETAIRITHVLTGIVVTCQNERSQTQNRETALKILRAKLFELEEEKRQKELQNLKGEHVKAEWGSQIRSYVLHPYQMVKDHRTDHEVGNAQAVLDGRLDDFMDAYLRYRLGH
ncbi:MAG TPA: peptide chain release factor 2 [Anaerolineae bacterium]|nr:peptide chain release factor 2 [Anaerolineae bacterium]